MTRLLGVCGMGNNPRRDSYPALRGEWFDGLLRGVRAAGGPAVDDADLACVSFGDLLRPPQTDQLTGPIPFLSQIHTYLTDQDAREQIRIRVASRIGPETHVVLAHSLGSIAAYESLCSLTGHNVRVLITLGSPLGFHRFVLDPRRAAGEQGRYPWPEGLPRWVNIFDPRDLFTFGGRLQPLFGDGRQVEDIQVDNRLWPHKLRSYLSAPETGRALTQALQPQRGISRPCEADY